MASGRPTTADSSSNATGPTRVPSPDGSGKGDEGEYRREETSSVVDVEGAKKAFAEMRRSFGDEIRHTKSRTTDHEEDVEKGEKVTSYGGDPSKIHDEFEGKPSGVADDDDEFDLLAYFRQDRNERVVILNEVKRRLAEKKKKYADGAVDLEEADKEGLEIEAWEKEAMEKTAGKRLGVTWENLEVLGNDTISLHIRTFPDAILEFFLTPIIPILKKIPSSPFNPKPKSILEGFNGYLKPGEMCLVLGRPGSGCSTFLKAISNQRVGYLGVNGEVTYGGMPSKEFDPRARYKGEVVYCQEGDLHQPTLTVAQTLNFALKTKTPPKKLRLNNEQARSDFRSKVIDVLTKMLGISHTKNTLVGNEFVRGVSGGERKRVSIAETMTTNACVTAWDNSTRGLDASTALDYAKSLRILTDVFDMTTFVSIYQAGEYIYEQFDKVLVIDSGHCVYFGPRTEARQYFIDLGYADLRRQTSADYLTGCTDENERRFAPGRDASNVPSTPEQLELAYRESRYFKEFGAGGLASYKAKLEAEIPYTRPSFALTAKAQKRSGVSSASPYQSSFLIQTWALTARQFRLRMQDRVGLSVTYATSIIIAIIVGSVYLNLPKDSSGAFSTGGVLFIGLLFNSFQAFNELPTQMLGRPIMWKHNSFAFYRPSALALGATLADLPIFLPEIIVFSIIIYFMTDLVRNGGAFFTFFALVWSSFVALSSFFRLLGCVCTNFDIASRLASVLVGAMVVYSGYLVPVFNMKRWLFWIWYMNPLNYGFQGIMANQFERQDMECVGVSIVPRNGPGVTKYPNEVGPNQVCVLAGARPGEPIVRGSDYIDAAYQFQSNVAWRNFGFIVAYFILFQFLQCVAMEYLKLGQGMPNVIVTKKPSKEEKELNARLQDRKQAFRSGQAEQDLSGLIQTRKPFTWEKLNYHVSVPGGQKQLLNDVYGYVKPGELTALMGASGAGKTTLLDVLADRKTTGVIKGDVLVNGRPRGMDFQRGTAYVEQLDVHESTATVREAMRFSAYLRQPQHVPKAEKDSYVEEVLQLLEMEDLADSMIGFPGFGLGVEARKRLTIGVELAAKPQLLLFLDEPTSGLDGQSAYNIVRFLRKLAAAGQAILCTIHQPNALLFEHFDRLLLLESGGRTVYHGPIGKDSSHLRDYFAKNGAECPAAANPAEFMLDAIGAGSQKRIGDKDWNDRWLESSEFAELKEQIATIKAESLAKPDSEDANALREYATDLSVQMRFVGERALTALWRLPDYGFTRCFNHITFALLSSLTWLSVGNSAADLQYRVFAIFMASVLPAIIITQIEPMYINSRNTFIRENSSKMYSPIVFALGQLIAETPYSILCSVCYFVLFYFPIGFQGGSDRAGYQFLIILVCEFYSVTLGQAVAALSPSIIVAAMANPFLLILFSIFCGVVIPKPQMPKFWRSWMYQLNPFTRLISGMIVTELHDLNVVCDPKEFAIFQPPTGQTCVEWAGDFVNSSGGYLDNPNDMSDCQYCQYRVGDEFYIPLEIHFGYRWRDLGIFIAYTFFNGMVTLVAARFLKYANR